MEIPESARKVIESGRLVHLVTVNRNGSPQVSLVWGGLEGEEIVVASFGEYRKIKNIRRDPRVSLSIETENVNETGLTEYLVVHGMASVTEGGAAELLQRLAYVYIGPDVGKFPPGDNPMPPGYVTHIMPTRFSGVGPWTA
jgi:PPOX class probable F420-dependent enzyme